MRKKYNPQLVRLLEVLSDGHYHDGVYLGDVLGLTRSAVWKAMKKLQAYGVAIHSVKGKGYVLLQPCILLSPRKIKLKQEASLVIFESVSSTNDYLKEAKPNRGIHFCLAEQQSQGRGRWNRPWYSPFAENVYLSCFYPFQKDVSELAGLSLITGLAIYHTVKSYGIVNDLFVKWPNDILVAKKKMAGSLIEIQAETHGQSQAIIGIGINVNMLPTQHSSLSQPFTSMRQLLNEYIDRNELCTRLMANLLHYLHQFEAHGFSPFIHEWSQADCLTKQTIRLQHIHTTIEGEVLGVNEKGNLLLRLMEGTVQAFSSGEVTIQKDNDTCSSIVSSPPPHG